MTGPETVVLSGADRVSVAVFLGLIALAVVLVLVGIPWLLGAPILWRIGAGLLFLMPPLISTCAIQFQSGLPLDRPGFLRNYLIALLDLGQHVLLILATLPIVAARLMLVIGAILVLALLVMLLLGAVQQAFGLHFDGISDFSRADMAEAGTWLAGVLTAMAVGWIAMRVVERVAPDAVRVADRAARIVRDHLTSFASGR